MIFDRYRSEKNHRKYTSTYGNDNDFNKALYNTKIIQGMFERINELEDRIKELEKGIDNRQKTNN